MKEPKRTPPFYGAATALATPFCEDGVDFLALGKMIDHQIAMGIDALVLCGTTGEAATLTEKEYAATLTFAAERIDRRVPLLAGSGTPDTARTLALSRIAERCGADALLVVTPYYNKGTQDGLVRHYHTVADGTACPILLYHVPGRTGVRLPRETVERIAAHPSIVGIKEASGDMEYFGLLSAALGDTLTLYTGCDALILPALSLGGGGVISVFSNLLPEKAVRLCRLFWDGDVEGACRLALELAPLCELLFAETNPAPLKCALALQGVCEGRLRLPLAPVSGTLEERLRRALDALT